MSPLARSLARVLVVSGLALSPLPAHATIYNWTNWAGGAATTTTNWSPNGFPYIGDMAVMSAPATFPTTWAAPADTMDFLWVTQGNPSFSISNRLGLTSGLAIRGISSLNLLTGTIWASQCYANYSDLGDLFVDGINSEVDAGGVDFGCFGGGASRIDVADGGRLFSRGQIHLAYDPSELFAGSIHHALRFGFPYLFYHYPVIYTLPDAYGNHPDCVIGGHGSASLDLYDGGYLNTIGRLFVGAFADGGGAVHCYPGGGLASGVTSNGETWIGANPTAGAAGGAATVLLEGSFSYFTGPCWLGDADDTPNGPVTKLLQVDNGAYTVFGDGLTMTAALTSRFDVTGGATRVIGGPVVIRQASPFLVGSSGGHAPALWLENGAATDFWPAGSAPALGVGRGGVGALYLAGAGTTVTVHGGLAMGDSTGGNATLVADSSATLTVQGPLTLGGSGSGYLTVKSPSAVLTVQDSTALGGTGALGNWAGAIFADSMGTAHLLGHTTIGASSRGTMLCYSGSQIDVAGLTLGPSSALLETDAGGTVTVSDHLDASSLAEIIVDYGGVVNYTNPAHGSTFGVPNGGAQNSMLIVNNGGLAKFSSELDDFGTILMYPNDTSGLVSSPTGAPPAPHARSARTAQTEIHPITGGRIECPLLRLRGAGHITATGTIAARLHIESGTATMQVSYDDAYFIGHGTVGDSTKTDGFTSLGTTTIGLDTLKVLDSDGGDLGKMTIAGGDLQLPKPGHLKSGFLLSGYGTVEGSLDVRDSAWVSLNGTVTGDVALAGALDLNRPMPVISVPAGTQAIRSLTLGSLHMAPTGRVAVQITSGGQDQITVNGAVVLGGTLDVRTLDGQMPTLGTLFTVLTGASVTGTFTSVTVNGHPNPGTVVVVYGSSNVRVAVLGTITGVGDGPDASSPPAELRFAPFGGPRAAELELDLPTTVTVKVSLYDVSGRQVADLAEGEVAAGRHRYVVGRAVPASGMYFARAVVSGAGGSRTLSTRVVVLR